MIALLAVGAKVQWRPYTSTGPSPLAASRSAVAPENPAAARGGSRFFLDTADVAEWEALLPLGMFHGVTTNPTLLERAGVACTVEACRQLAVTAGALGVEEIMFQAWGATTEAMVDQGLRLASIEPARVTVKVPVTAAGTAAAAELVQRGVRVCLTACYGREQALVAASVGAEYLAPYLGRMDDAGKDGMAECRAMQATACEHACIRAMCTLIVDGLGSTARMHTVGASEHTVAASHTYGLQATVDGLGSTTRIFVASISAGS